MGHKQQKEKPLSDVENYKDYRRVCLQTTNYTLLHLLALDSLLINYVQLELFLRYEIY
jgi:hypothetical protein